MEIPDSTVITKLTNGNVSITATGGPFNVDPGSELTKELDGVKARSDEGVLHDFKVTTVEKVVRDDGTEVIISDVDTLYSELNTFFFFKLTVTPAILSSFTKTEEITQTLNDGDNTISHNLGKPIIGFTVKDGDLLVNTTGSDIDLNDFNINLSGGGPITDATIYLNYQ